MTKRDWDIIALLWFFGMMIMIALTVSIHIHLDKIQIINVEANDK